MLYVEKENRKPVPVVCLIICVEACVSVFLINMQRLKDKLHIPKAQSFHEVGSLETIVRDSIYLAWPAASFDSGSGASDKKESRRYLQRQPDAIEEEDDDDNE